MHLTPEQIAKIRQKEAMTPDAKKRNPLNDYTEGWFHVTLNVRTESPIMGYIVGNVYAPDGSEDEPKCLLTDLGKKVESTWRGVSSFHPMCICEAIQVMPDHIHVLLHLLPGNNEHLGQVVNGVMIGCTHCYWDTLGIPWREMRKAKDAAASSKAHDKLLRAQWQDRDHSRSYRGPSLLVRGYNDVEAVTDEEIEVKRRYIHDNPRKALITHEYPDRFHVERNKRSGNWTLARALGAVAADYWIGRNPAKCRQLQANVLGRLKRLVLSLTQTPQASHTQTLQASHTQTPQASPTIGNDGTEMLAIEYVGNRGLLTAERKVSLICHRADVAMFEQQKATVLKAAREGAVVVSAFISPKEREIMKQLMTEQLPFIEIMDNGFGERYKPVGKAFYSVAENRHLQMTCWTYEYRREDKSLCGDVGQLGNLPASASVPSISREMCLVMNELVRIISDVKDDWWKAMLKMIGGKRCKR